MRGMRHPGRAAAIVAMSAAAAIVLSACSGSAGGTSGDDLKLSDKPVTLSFTWWGNDARTAITQKLIAAFEKKHPTITIKPQFTDWAGYWDKLATETAANNTPDIIQMDEKYISTYGGRGALLDLKSMGKSLDLSDFPKSALQTGDVDGKLYGVPVGLTSYSFIVNPTLLADAGVSLPDDKTWTWDDLKAAGAAVSKAGGGKVFGVQSWGFEDGGLNNWARQHGDALYNKKGEVVIKPETLTSWWQYLLDLTNEGVTPPASGTIEKQTAGLSASYTATNTAAFGNWWNSQLTALSDASGQPLKLMRIPTSPDAKEGSAYYKPSMYWSVSSRTKHPAEAALFLDYLANSKEAADLLLTERGVPANTTIRAYIAPKLSDTDKQVVAFLDDLADSVGEAPPVTPAGGSAIEALLTQYTEKVLFKKATPADAASGFIKDLKQAILAG